MSYPGGLTPDPIAERLRAKRLGYMDSMRSRPLNETGLSYTEELAGSSPPWRSRLVNALSFLKLAFEPLARAQSAHRVAVLTATGKYEPREFKRRVSDAFSGKLRVSDKEFSELLINKSTHDALAETNAIPGWTKALTTPEFHLAGIPPERVPRVSVATLFDFALGATLGDPFLITAFTPVGAVGKLAAAAPKPLTEPFRILTNGLGRWLGPESEAGWGVANLVRQPAAIFSGKARPVFEDTAVAYMQTKEAIHDSALAFRDRLVAEGLARKPGWRNLFDHTKGVLDDVESRRRIGDALSRTGFKAKLTAPERRVFEIMNDFVRDEADLLVRAGAVTREQVTEALAKGTLGEFFPHLMGNRAVARDILQSFDLDTLGKIHLGLREGRKLPESLKWENLDGLETFKAFLFASKRKQHLEPALLKYAVKRHPNAREATTADLVAKRIAAGENEITANLSGWQRRYLVSWHNEFTGHGRGRTFLQWEVQSGLFWDKVLQHPLGQRVDRVFRLTGAQEGLDGLLGLSPTARITSLMTHNIFRATVGGNLSSALVNLSQTANTAIAHGIPATLKGMLRFHDPSFKLAREQADLLRDYKLLFDPDTWRKNFGALADDVLFAGFDSAERIIRGLAFNVGLDDALKAAVKSGKLTNASVREAIDRGIIDDVIRKAHFDSIESSFIYGTLGRSPYFTNPLLLPIQSLVSFGPKQAEFLRATFARDGGAFLRFIGLNGFLIEQANKHLGIAAERTLGWGFIPQTRTLGGIPILESPPVRLLVDLAQGLEATAKGDLRTRDMMFKKVLASMPTALGASPYPFVEWGWIPGHPEMGGDVQKLAERVATGRQRIGEGHVPISQFEAWASFFAGGTTRMQERINLRRTVQRARSLIDHTLDQRALALVNAITDPKRKGDAFFKANAAMAEPIWVEGTAFWPEWTQYRSRINYRFDTKRVSADDRALDELGILEQVFLQRQLELLYDYDRYGRPK